MAEEKAELMGVSGEAYQLRRSINFDGAQVTTLNIDFEKLTGADIAACDQQYTIYAERTGDFARVKEFSKNYLAFVVARAASVPVEQIFALSAKDFVALTIRAQSFFLGPG